MQILLGADHYPEYLDQGVRVHRLTPSPFPAEPGCRSCTPRVVSHQVEPILQITRPDVTLAETSWSTIIPTERSPRLL